MNGIEQLVVGTMFGVVGAVGQPLPEDLKSEAVECLALNMYHEARGQGTAGELAVTTVVMNRVNDSRFPNTICRVVTQKSKRKCQFTWYCSKPSRKSINDHDAYSEALSLAWKLFYANRLIWDVTDGAMWYHADYIEAPVWTKNMTITHKIGTHIFYTDGKN